MKRHEKYGFLLLFVLIVLVLSAYLIFFKRSAKSPESSPDRQRTIGELPQEPIVPAGYQKIAPAPADNSKEMLAQTSTIFRGSLKDVRFTYDGCAGPRTEYVFSNSSPLLGEKLDVEVNLKVLGGPTPRGTWLAVSELPQLALDSEYVVFLRNTDWTFSPIVGNLVFRVETIAGRELLVNPDGRAVTGWGIDGPLLSAGTVSEVVGSRLRAYRSSSARDRGDNRTSDTTDPKGEVARTDVVAPGQPATQGRTHDSTLARAPSAVEIRKAGMFEKPALSVAALSNEPTVPVNTFIGAIKAAAERDHIQIGGRVALDPNWRCWSTTPTMKAKR